MTPEAPNRERKLRNALDTIRLYGGVIGATEAAERIGVPSSNLKWHLAPWTTIGCGGVYLVADVEEAIKRRDRKAGEAE